MGEVGPVIVFIFLGLVSDLCKAFLQERKLRHRALCQLTPAHPLSPM